MMLRIWVAIAAILALSGCAGLRDLFGGDQCNASTIAHGSEWEIDGLRIPRNPTDAFTIGRVKYAKVQAQKLSDDAKALEDLRLAHCTDARLVEKMIDKGYVNGDKVLQWSSDFTKNWNETRVKLKHGLQNARTPEEGLASSENAKAEMEKAKEKSDQQKALISAGASTPNPPPWEDDLKNLRGDVQALGRASKNLSENVQALESLREAVQLLDSRVRTIESSPPARTPRVTQVRISIIGFSPHGVGINSAERMRVADAVKGLLLQAPVGSQWTADLVGYADATGGQLTNFRLGLQRAQIAAQLLVQLFPEVQIGSVASGGVAGRRASDRRVEISFSPAPSV